MNKGINLQIEDFKKNLLEIINKANLPISVIDMVLQNISTECTSIKKKQILHELKEYEANKDIE